MRTVFVLTDHNFVGGAEVNYKDVIRAYQKKNIHITFIAPGTNNIQVFFKKNNLHKVSYRNLPEKYLSLRSRDGKISIFNIIKNYFAYKKNRSYLQKLISKEKPSAIISNAVISHLLISNITKEIVRIAHIQDIVDRKQLFGIYGKILDYTISKVDKVVTISDAVLNTFSDKYLHKIHKLYNPVFIQSCISSSATQTSPDPAHCTFALPGGLAQNVRLRKRTALHYLRPAWRPRSERKAKTTHRIALSALCWEASLRMRGSTHRTRSESGAKTTHRLALSSLGLEASLRK